MKTSLSSLVLLLFYNLAFCQLPLIDSINISPRNYKRNFEQINTIVKDNYSHISAKKINIDSLFNDVNHSISESLSKDEYFKYLLYYFSELKNSHTTLYIGEYGINATVDMVENRLFLKEIDDKIFEGTGIRIRNEILKIDNMPVVDWLQEQCNYVSSSTRQHDINNALWKVFKSEFKLVRKYEIKTAEGIKTIELNIDKPFDYSVLFSSSKPKVNHRLLNDSTAYILISTMTGNVVQEFENAYESYRGLTNLIVDIRENTGGSSVMAEQIARYLINKSQKACVSRKKIRPRKSGYEGNLYLLIGIKTASAAESFAIDIWESGNATLVGGITAGDTGNGPKNYSTDFGIRFRIPTRKPAQTSIHNFPMEGRGVPPNHTINQTVSDYLNGVDTVLEFTLKDLIRE